MAHNPEANFPKRLSTLQQIVNRRQEFPIVVKTRNKLLSFQKMPIEEEGKIIFIESEMALTYARIKVLKFPDEQKVTSELGADFCRLHSSFEGEEFYMPLGCPGKLRIIPYPGIRRRYVNVSSVMQENPRYLQAVDDIMAVPPRHTTDHCLTCIPAGTIIEPKSVVHQNKVRYLKCVNKKGSCFYLREDGRANFTSISDTKEYSLQQIQDAGILLPTPIQFVPGTISPYDVVLFHDDMASNNLVITNGPLEVLEIVTIKTLIAKARDSERDCFKTLLFPQTIYKTFHVQEAEFRTFELKSRFVERKFGGCQGDNDLICCKMYLIPADGDLVAWLRNPRLLTKDVHFCDSSDSDSDYEIQEIQPVPKAPPLPEKIPIQNQEKLREMHTTILLPIVQIQDRDVLQMVKDKTKLGFGKVHDELKRIFKTTKGKKKRSMSDSSYQAIKESKDKSVKPTKTNPKQSHKELEHSNSMEETNTTYQTNENKSKYGHFKKAPLPSLPRGASWTAIDSSDDEDHDYSYIDMNSEPLPLPPSNKERKKITARVEPISFSTKNDTNSKPTALTSPVQRKLEACKLDLDNSLLSSASKSETSFPRSPTNDSVDATPETYTDYEDCLSPIEDNSKNVNKQPSHLTNMDFFTYSIEETTACLKYCGLEQIANICNEQKLDGEFFKHTDEAAIKDSLNMSALDVLKLKRIYNGWRPKYN